MLVEKFNIETAKVSVAISYNIQPITSASIDSLYKCLRQKIVRQRKKNEGVLIGNRATNLTGVADVITYYFNSCNDAINESESIANLLTLHTNQWLIKNGNNVLARNYN